LNPGGPYVLGTGAAQMCSLNGVMERGDRGGDKGGGKPKNCEGNPWKKKNN